ncbi:hypothetical protein HanXRQr2_Chr04g0175821 [Helianthus annuus]|uniref:Uncharacterized protein n=1 Tax=Helianthus annuus TaxID=4232 RepID=A0A9K3J912_HELAN|nr:hypothetical protein HanXRQr2_Chr04g0175821 [Helianthus annuus]
MEVITGVNLLPIGDTKRLKKPGEPAMLKVGKKCIVRKANGLTTMQNMLGKTLKKSIIDHCRARVGMKWRLIKLGVLKKL